jgi:Transcription factor Pcc1
MDPRATQNAHFLSDFPRNSNNDAKPLFPEREDFSYPSLHHHPKIMTTNEPFPYKCDLEISLPTARHAETVKKALEVDQEIGDRVTKSFSLKPGINTADLVVLLV